MPRRPQTRYTSSKAQQLIEDADVNPIKPKAFSTLKLARELLRQRATEFIDKYMQIVEEARVAGDYESAYRALQWLIDHVPADADGERMVERSTDKDPSGGGNEGSGGPQISVGIMLGGLTPQVKQLPEAKVINVERIKVPESES